MSVEKEFKDLLLANGYFHRKTKIGSAWTLEHKQYMIINFHNNGTISFNYLGKYMRDAVKKQRGTILDLRKQDKERLYTNELSKLPFFKAIEHSIKFSLRAKGGDYMNFSEKVGMNVLREVVKYIVTDAGGKFVEK
jgi:predicted RNA binding protein YcfA (HicA-like mRNA interferase family)